MNLGSGQGPELLHPLSFLQKGLELYDMFHLTCLEFLWPECCVLRWISLVHYVWQFFCFFGGLCALLELKEYVILPNLSGPLSVQDCFVNSVPKARYFSWAHHVPKTMHIAYVHAPEAPQSPCSFILHILTCLLVLFPLPRNITEKFLLIIQGPAQIPFFLWFPVFVFPKFFSYLYFNFNFLLYC